LAEADWQPGGSGADWLKLTGSLVEVVLID